jgi:hypothetical protein
MTAIAVAYVFDNKGQRKKLKSQEQGKEEKKNTC